MHILLLEIPQLLRGILEYAIRMNGDCIVLKDEQWVSQVSAPDVVILGLTDADDTTLLPALFARWPQAQVMTLMPAGDDAAVYELRLGRKTLGAVSPDEIMQVLRKAARRKRPQVAQ